ncbi:flagellar hook-associated protein 1 FlgK [Virgibacillus natechei]|uniref:Flagellar hook-associated protein 1 n=1 Tax=Virgibacillus natechei TaxID=1216297 RepID=A0ABS4IL81_9BACI|nr:flagellar hook-associated protein FlgK [Virgibacillus natechei]MBP1971171.1 flagellar hook-associated protein 1 FlgK [Virgibacillus natechei]UZD11918.1 flagellar hook-associated protein FlgK [Virgibacillus natechei]
MSTFHGLEMARQALSTQQSALYTTGHNIANANTEGYSRQRVNFESASPYPAASRNQPVTAGQMGTGVEAGSVQRIRDEFLDHQYRAENSKEGYWETKSDALSRMEGLMNEPSENGLSNTMDQFWESLQDLSVNPESSGERSVAVQRGVAVAENFNYLSESLDSIRSDLKNQIDQTEEEVNSLLNQIDNINEQVKQTEVNGNVANDLYDERDRLIDELSNVINIKVSYSKSAESAPDVADGLATIEIVDDKGNSLGVKLVDAEADEDERVNELEVNYADNDSEEVTSVTVGEEPVEIMGSNGSLKGLVEAYGYESEDEDNETAGIYTDMLSDLDDMADVFATEFNDVHSNGYDLNGETDADFFNFEDNAAASSIVVSDYLVQEPDKLAASEDENAGNGDNASNLAEVFNKTNLESDALGPGTSINGFYESLIADMGVIAQEANRMTNNTGALKSQVENQRMSVSAVSLDEEMSNMIKFQHAYSAAARSMTAVDELLDQVINNMGLVGR